LFSPSWKIRMDSHRKIRNHQSGAATPKTPRATPHHISLESLSPRAPNHLKRRRYPNRLLKIDCDVASSRSRNARKASRIRGARFRSTYAQKVVSRKPHVRQQLEKVTVFGYHSRRILTMPLQVSLFSAPLAFRQSNSLAGNHGCE
jgi:hypothetical protein